MKVKAATRSQGGYIPLTSVIGAGGRPWLRFPCIDDYQKVFHPLFYRLNRPCRFAPLYTTAIFYCSTNQTAAISTTKIENRRCFGFTLLIASFVSPRSESETYSFMKSQ